MKLRYELVGSGWAECAVEIGGQEAVASASYLSDALDSLCAAVVALLRGEQAAAVRFDEEPGEYRWRFDRVGPERVRVRILEFRELWGDKRDEEGRVVLDAECRLRTFAGALLSELQRLLAEHGEEGYKERWVLHEFPRRRLSQLSQLLAD